MASIKIPSLLERVWIFGYGSLIWKPGFHYDDRMTGYIKGVSRRFWQSDILYRGTKTKPGRVATLVPMKDGKVWGAAYEVVGRNLINEAVSYLDKRETVGGGYTMVSTMFYRCPGRRCHRRTRVPAIVYLATHGNRFFTGPEPDDLIAERIIDAEGKSGHNVEYVIRLAEFMHNYCPERDEHLLRLESLIKTKLELRDRLKAHTIEPVR
ncbi:putative glutathione-specific gamma-glutamylcyclotransferase 2 [Tubulanus polymorphus]|uniref:putative glutathione-specific gamma-glutamylcyclotransferase 2 n=1 Tax=Tubulanus polymorphus TaxID=672921 RepID=UPI003DA21AE7